MLCYCCSRSYACASALEPIALKAMFLFPILILQRPTQKTKSKDVSTYMTRRFELWRSGSFSELVAEGKAIQSMQHKQSGRQLIRSNNKSFKNSMFEGNVKPAIRLLSQSDKGQPLALDDLIDTSSSQPEVVRDILHRKHPPAQPASPDSLISPYPPSPDDLINPHPVIFDQLDGDLIKKCALRTNGSAGPSVLDAAAWKRLCSSFKSSSDLCDTLALLSRRICSTYIHPEGLSAFVACRLITLDKHPGVRPIGVAETCRRIIGKAILQVIQSDIINVAGPLQLCADQDSGCEAAVHAIRWLFDDSDTEAILLIDASNAFNSLNRQSALRNILHICPSFGPVLVNTYRGNPHLFIDGDTLLSSEGTTQGDPLAMPMYALGIKPLILHMASIDSVKQVWCADDATALGSVTDLLLWWRTIVEKSQDTIPMRLNPGSWLNPNTTIMHTKYFKVPTSLSPPKVAVLSALPLAPKGLLTIGY